MRYELARSPKEDHHHHHLVCTSCAKIIDYADYVDEELKLLRKTEIELSRKYDFNITSHIVQFYGICRGCGAKKDSPVKK